MSAHARHKRANDACLHKGQLPRRELVQCLEHEKTDKERPVRADGACRGKAERGERVPPAHEAEQAGERKARKEALSVDRRHEDRRGREAEQQRGAQRQRLVAQHGHAQMQKERGGRDERGVGGHESAEDGRIVCAERARRQQLPRLARGAHQQRHEREEGIVLLVLVPRLRDRRKVLPVPVRERLDRPAHGKVQRSGRRRVHARVGRFETRVVRAECGARGNAQQPHGNAREDGKADDQSQVRGARRGNGGVLRPLVRLSSSLEIGRRGACRDEARLSATRRRRRCFHALAITEI